MSFNGRDIGFLEVLYYMIKCILVVCVNVMILLEI